MKSIIHTLFIRHHKIEEELSAICREYAEICEKLRELHDDKDNLILERHRRKLVNRIHILNFRLGSVPMD